MSVSHRKAADPGGKQLHKQLTLPSLHLTFYSDCIIIVRAIKMIKQNTFGAFDDLKNTVLSRDYR